MPTYSVRQIFRWRIGRDQKKKYLYEERITLWRAKTIDRAVDLAEAEADRYAKASGFKFSGYSQAFWLFEDLKPRQGMEIFSLLRESDLPLRMYLKTFYKTGHEHEGSYKAEPSAGGNAAPPRASA
jgi:hypothetical protein